MFRWEGGAAFMILELGSILTDYVRQLSFPCISHFPGHGSYTWPGTFNQSPLGIQYPKLVCRLRKLQERRRITGPICWACAQGRYGTGPRACMGLGSRCRTFTYIYFNFINYPTNNSIFFSVFLLLLILYTIYVVIIPYVSIFYFILIRQCCSSIYLSIFLDNPVKI